MKVENIDIAAAIENTRTILENESNISPSTKSMVELLLLIITLLVNRLNLNSKNSSKPPSSDPNRNKDKKNRNVGDKKPGGQPGHPGTTLEPVKDPDIIEPILVELSDLPKGNYREVGYETRQVIDLKITRCVTEYQAQILEDESGKRYTASFPEGVDRHVQYGKELKAHAIYLSQHQLIPYKRISEYFQDQAGIPIGTGSIFNFNNEAFNRLATFDKIVKEQLIASPVCHVDETGINKNGDRIWLHCVSNDKFTSYFPHEKRGGEAIDAMGIIPSFEGVLVHDHWKPYFNYNCLHSLCNAHHLRELERAYEQDNQQWAQDMKNLLLKINNTVDHHDGKLPEKISQSFIKDYRDIIKKAQYECPPPDETKRVKGKRGRMKRSKARNLLERLSNFELETLRFMYDPLIPFTNNRGENDIRMTKVQQKISGCFRSMEGALIFCRIRGYISTCKKNNVHASEALRLLLNGDLPSFLTSAHFTAE